MRINSEAIVRRIEQRTTRAVENVVKWTAFDVQRAAKASIKSGGKNRGAKNWQTSKPGEAPRSHVGTLKQAIRVAKESATSYVVGSEKRGNGSALRALEHGGESKTRATFYADAYVARIRRKKRPVSRQATSGSGNRTNRAAARTVSGDVAGRVHPKAARSYTLYTRDNPRGVRVTEYRYFYSRDAWERARNTAAFQDWGRTVRQTTVASIRIAARPFMAPALIKEANSSKMNARISRAFGQFK